MPAVSAIVTTYNRAHMVTGAIKSVFDQTYKDFELIIVDDGSTDDTQTALQKYADRATIIHQQNQGLSGARNTAIAAASGKYVAFLDDDDLWLPERLARQVPLLEDSPDIALVFSDADLINEDGRITGRWSDFISVQPMICLETLFMYNYIPVLTTLVRRTAFEDVGLFDPVMKKCEDYDMWLRILQKYRAVYHPAQLAQYRIWSGGKSQDKLAMLEQVLHAKERAVLRAKRLQSVPDSFLQRHCYSKFEQLAATYDQMGCNEQADDVRKRQQELRKLCADV